MRQIEKVSLSYKVKWEGFGATLLVRLLVDVAIRQEAFDQVAVYNRVVQARCLLVSNGLDHYCYAIDRKREEYRFLDRVPRYEEFG